MENKRGITLVALVVTIVVLLILAGVSINLVLGENGLISNAKEARDKTLEAEKKEGESLNTASHYIKQTAGVSASGITADDYGKVVTNYNADGKTWEIFYADSNNIYLITRNSAGNQSLAIALKENSGYNGTSDFDGSEEFKKKYPAVQAGWLNKTYTPSENGIGTVNYESNYNNMKCTEYLLDSSVWNVKYKTENADWAIGAPTLELFVKSYNNVFKSKEVEISAIENESTGYKYNDVLYTKGMLPTNDSKINGTEKSNIYNHGYHYWLACPSNNNGNNLRIANFNERCLSTDVGNADYGLGIRPVVCLNSSVTLIESDDGNTFSIK